MLQGFFERENFMKITPMSTLSDVLNNPVGYDIAQMVVYRNNLSNDILENPF